MRKLIILLVAVALTAGVGVAAMAAAPTANQGGPAQDVACAFGTCFSDRLDFVGDFAKFSGPAAGRVEFADCCIAGDVLKLIVSGPRGKATMRHTSAGSLGSDCSFVPGPYPDDTALELTGGVTSAKYVLVASTAGITGAWFRVSAGGWVRTVGTPDCPSE